MIVKRGVIAIVQRIIYAKSVKRDIITLKPGNRIVIAVKKVKLATPATQPANPVLKAKSALIIQIIHV